MKMRKAINIVYPCAKTCGFKITTWKKIDSEDCKGRWLHKTLIFHQWDKCFHFLTTVDIQDPLTWLLAPCIFLVMVVFVVSFLNSNPLVSSKLINDFISSVALWISVRASGLLLIFKESLHYLYINLATY